ncbi:SRPBCC family protein [Leucobacter sp. 1207-22]|uniref:SRPBCC family protein n=1 Tax=Leucobacter sp. 1207-22 TaxID=2604456 RepID=UPI00406481FE
MHTTRSFSDSIFIAASPEEVYAAVSDVTRTGEWSPVCRECWWESGDGPAVGAVFTGRNDDGTRVWETQSTVITAAPGVEFGWSVGPGRTNWIYRMQPVDGGTELTEAWEWLPEGQEYVVNRFPDDVEEQIANRESAARTGIPETLAAIKRVIEAA